MRVAPLVTLSPEERVVLDRWSRRPPSDPRARKARIVLEAAAGARNVDIARELGVSRLTVARWRARFLAARLRAMDRPSPRSGGASRVADETLRAIVRATRSSAPGRPRPASTRSVARAFGVSHSTVRRIWTAHGVRPERFEVWPPRPDPRAPLVPGDVIAVGLRPGWNAIACSLVVPPAGSRDMAPPGRPTDRSLNQLVALVTWDPEPRPRARTADVARFLGELGAALGPSRDARLLVHARDPAIARPFERWRLRHPRVDVVWADDVDTWRKRVGEVLEQLGRRGPRVRNFGDRGELARAIRLFLASYRHDAGPFEWVASEHDIAAGESGYRLRYTLSGTGHGGFKPRTPVAPPMRSSSVNDPRARAIARTVLRQSLGVRAGERVTIESWSEPIAFANAFVLEALDLGARPLLIYQDEPTYWAAATQVPAAHLAHVGEQTRAALERSDVFVSFFGPSDRERFHALPRPLANRLSEYRDELYEAAAKAGARTVQMAIGRVSAASARMYGVDLTSWRNELIDATLVRPATLRRRAAPLAAALRRGRRVVIRHENGTDLSLGLRHRAAEISDGFVRPSAPNDWSPVQLPGGVVMVALDERSGDGTFLSNVPNSVGVMDSVGEISRGCWVFEAGRLRRFRYEQGQELFERSFGRAGPGRDRPGALSIGLNERIDAAPLLLDQGLGTITLQIGRNDYVGGATRLGWWAWLILRGADLAIDGRTYLRQGRLVP